MEAADHRGLAVASSVAPRRASRSGRLGANPMTDDLDDFLASLGEDDPTVTNEAPEE
jgi:hypothetical protein